MDYLTINEHRTPNTALDTELMPYDEGYSDGATGCQAHPTMRADANYRKGYVKGLVQNMKEIAERQRTHVDPSTGFDWF